MIIDAVAVQREDDPHSFDISLKLNRTALKIWLQLVYDNHNQQVVLIDDAYYSMFNPDSGHDEDTEWVTLRGPFNEVFANGIGTPFPSDKRQFSVFPSDKMQKILPEIKEVSHEWMTLISNGIPKDELAIFDSVLCRMQEKAREIIESQEDNK